MKPGRLLRPVFFLDASPLPVEHPRHPDSVEQRRGPGLVHGLARPAAAVAADPGAVAGTLEHGAGPGTLGFGDRDERVAEIEAAQHPPAAGDPGRAGLAD